MDEKKTYAITGTVTIGTDEYRDLIEENVKNEKELSTERNKRWNVESQNKKLIEEKSALSAKVAEYTEFVNSCTEATALYKAFIAEKTLKGAHMI